MALTLTNVGASAAPDFNDVNDSSTYLSSSWTPPSSGLVFIVVGSRNGSAGNNPPSSITGNSITWTQIAETGTGRFNLSLFGGNASGSSTGQTTFNYSSTRAAMTASFFRADGVDLSSGTAAAFVQAVVNGGTSTSGSISLASAGASGNRPISGWMLNNLDEAITERTNWSEVDEIPTDVSETNPGRVETQWRSDTFETTASASWTSNNAWRGIAAEIKASLGGGSLVPINRVRTLTRM